MPAKLYPFIDIAVHERVRGHFARGDAAVLFSPDLRRVLWSNGQGAQLFKMASIYDFLDSGANMADVAYRQMEAAARQLAVTGERRQFLMRIASGFQRVPVNASVELIALRGSETAILFAAPHTGKALTPTASAAQMISGFDDPDTHMAVLDGDGAVLAASAGFEALDMNAQTRRSLVNAVARDPNWLVKRPVPTGRGHLPAAIGKLSDDPALHLVFAVETILGTMDPGRDFDEIDADEPDTSVGEPETAEQKPVSAFDAQIMPSDQEDMGRADMRDVHEQAQDASWVSDTGDVPEEAAAGGPNETPASVLPLAEGLYVEGTLQADESLLPAEEDGEPDAADVIDVMPVAQTDHGEQDLPADLHDKALPAETPPADTAPDIAVETSIADDGADAHTDDARTENPESDEVTFPPEPNVDAAGPLAHPDALLDAQGLADETVADTLGIAAEETDLSDDATPLAQASEDADIEAAETQRPDESSDDPHSVTAEPTTWDDTVDTATERFEPVDGEPAGTSEGAASFADTPDAAEIEEAAPALPDDVDLHNAQSVVDEPVAMDTDIPVEANAPDAEHADETLVLADAPDAVEIEEAAPALPDSLDVPDAEDIADEPVAVGTAFPVAADGSEAGYANETIASADAPDEAEAEGGWSSAQDGLPAHADDDVAIVDEAAAAEVISDATPGIEAVDYSGDAAMAVLSSPMNDVPRAQRLSSFVFNPSMRAARFVWKIDANGTFSEVSPEFAAAVGPHSADIVGMSFDALAARYDLDRDDTIRTLLQKRDTWSGKMILWPVEATRLRVPVDLAALPTYSRNREFDGFRGFGIVRVSDAVDDALETGLTIGVEVSPEPAIPDPDREADPLPNADMGSEAALSVPFVTDNIVAEPEFGEPADVAADEVAPQTLTDGEDSGEQGGDAMPAGIVGSDATEFEPPTSDHPAPAEDDTGDIDEQAAEIPTDETPALISTMLDDAPVAQETRAADTSETAGAVGETTDAVVLIEVSTDNETDLEPDIAHDTETISTIDAAEPAESVSGVVSDAAETAAPPIVETEPHDDTMMPEQLDDDLFAGLGDPRPQPVDVHEDPFRGERPALKLADTAGRRSSDKVVAIEDHRDATAEALTRSEQAAFREIARQLGDTFGKRQTQPDDTRAEDEALARPPKTGQDAQSLKIDEPDIFAGIDAVIGGHIPGPRTSIPLPATGAVDGEPALEATIEPVSAPENIRTTETAHLTQGLLENLPVALLVHGADELFHANPEFLKLTAYASLAELQAEGGLDALFVGDEDGLVDTPDGAIMLIRADGHLVPVTARLQAVRFEDRSVLMMALSPAEQAASADEGHEDAAIRAELDTLRVETDELRSILETATDGVVVVGPEGEIRSLNRSANALFNYDDTEIRGKPFAMLFAHESQKAVLDYLAGLAGHGVASVLNDGREVIGREASGGFIPLFMTMGRLSSSGYCAVIRDITQWKRTEEELRNAKRAAETANAHKTDFLARVSHEIRTPLNAIIGFSDMMASEHFGPIGNARYLEYSGDIGRSGRHVLDIVNDLLDISKIEAGEMDLEFTAVEINEAVSEAVSLVQPQANGQRVIIRTSLSASVPNVVADSRSIKQIALNILSNAIRFTPSGGQIVVSTTYEANGSVILRIRDTGIGMTRTELEQAMKPFRQVTTGVRKRGDGTGLGLPLTKAMAEANRAQFSINSAPNEGTLVEISFPSQRVLAD